MHVTHQDNRGGNVFGIVVVLFQHLISAMLISAMHSLKFMCAVLVSLSALPAVICEVVVAAS